jgi:hypothetical protein
MQFAADGFYSTLHFTVGSQVSLQYGGKIRLPVAFGSGKIRRHFSEIGNISLKLKPKS